MLSKGLVKPLSNVAMNVSHKTRDGKHLGFLTIGLNNHYF